MSLISRLLNKNGQNQSIETYDGAAILKKQEYDEQEADDSMINPEPTEKGEVNKDSEETYEVLEREIHPAKIICPDCGGITLEGLEFCDKCGGEIQQ